MKLKSLKCPDCNGNLEIEDGRAFCFCQYCGCKIILDDEKQEYTITKNININKTTSHTERYINDADVIREKRKAKESRGKNLELPLLLLGFFVCLFLLFYISVTGEKKSIAEEEQLQIVVEEILEDIENGNYDEAYVKANSLHYTSNWSSEIEEKWDETREALLDKIKQAETGSSGTDKKSFWDWFN